MYAFLSSCRSKPLAWACAVACLWATSCQSKEPEKLDPSLPGDVPLSKEAATARRASDVGLFAVAPTPRHFPRHTDADVTDMFDKTARIADAAIFIYQWSEPDFVKTAGTVVELCRQRGLTPVLAISPTSIDAQRGRIDVPARLKGGLFNRPSFSKADVQQAFIADAEALARLKPPYLCLATEINLLALQNLKEFLHFAKTYKEAYHAVKRISPDTRVFVSFQYDFMRVIDHREPNKIAEHAKVIEVFRPELDLIVITSYPGDFYAAPDDMPANYYAYLRKYLHPGDEVMVMEIGWPSGKPGTPTEQQRFVQLLPILLADLHPVMTAWSLLHDVEIPQFGSNLATTGLYTASGEPKPSLDFVPPRKSASTKASQPPK